MAGKGAKHGNKTYTAAEAREHFATLLDQAAQGEIVVITKHGVPVAQLTRAAKPGKMQIPPPGYLEAQGWKIKMAEDFDAIPEGFEDYV
jgi:prevent-host-death family protein